MRKLFVFTVLCLFCMSAYADFDGVVTRVIDGDTVVVSVMGDTRRVRLYGIDAPELKQAYGEESQRILSEMILNKVVTIAERGTDRYSRIIGIILLKGVDIGGNMVKNGHAWCYKAYDREKLYWDTENEAKNSRRGLWGAGTPVAPWVFRKEQKGKS